MIRVGFKQEVIWLICSSIFLLWTVNAGQVDYTDCGSKANITELRISDCTEPPCIFLKGKTYKIEIDAISNCVSTTLPYKVTAKIKFFPVTLLKGNACDVLSRGSCPVAIGEEFTYENSIKVNPSYPSFHTKVTAVVQGDKGQSLICVVIDAQIKKNTMLGGQYYYYNSTGNASSPGS